MTEIQGKSILVRVSDRFELGAGIIYRLEGGGWRILGGDHLIFRRTKGGISRNLDH